MTTFLNTVTDDLIHRFGFNGLERLTLVFPMQRAGLFIRQYLSQLAAQTLGDTPIVLPHFTTIDALVDNLCELHSDDEINSVCTLYQIYLQHTHHQLPIDAFYGWGIQLLNDFSNADMALVDGNHLMRFSAQATQLEQTCLNEETHQRLEQLIHESGPQNSVQQYFTDLWAALPDIYTDFQLQQLSAGLGTRGARSKWVIQHFSDDSVQQRILGRTYVFIGFNYLLAAERRIMQLFQSHSALFYWDYNPDFTLYPEAYQFIRNNIKEFDNALPATTAKNHPTEITSIACQSSSAQAQYVHDWLLQHHQPGQRSAIVIADESLLQSVIYSLPDPQQLSAPINITKGYPLRSTHLFAHTLSVLHSYVDNNLPTDQMLPALIAELDNYYHQMQRPQSDSWQAVLLDESYYQIQLILRQMHLLLIQNDFVRSQLNLPKTLRNLICRKLEMVTIPFHGEPVTDIQIIGVLETRLLDFDHVLILNAEEGVIPAVTSDRSFLPYDLRREYGMTTREEDTCIFAYNFFRLFQRAQDVTLTFSDSFTDHGKRTMSRFLMQMLCSSNYHIQRFRLTESATILPITLPPTTFTANDALPPYLSPSAISTYIECPREFYLSKILHINESSVNQVMLPPNTIGDLLHATMHHAYLTICQDAVDNLQQLAHPVQITHHVIQSFLQQPDALSQALDHAYSEVNTTFLRFHPNASIEQPFRRFDHEAENHAILRMAHNILLRDMQMTPFTLVWLEHPLNIRINNISIYGIIDRLDIVQENGQSYIRVVDYKTSGFSKDRISFQWNTLFTDPDKRYALQTLIYSEMVRQHLPSNIDTHLPIRPELIFAKQLSQLGNLMIDSEGDTEPITDYSQCQSVFMSGLQGITSDIASHCAVGQEFPMQTDVDLCAKSNCPFHLLCAREQQPVMSH